MQELRWLLRCFLTGFVYLLQGVQGLANLLREMMRHLRHQLKNVLFRVVRKCPQKQLETFELPCSIARRLAIILINTATSMRLLVMSLVQTSGDVVTAAYHVGLHY